jgi:hypothetical protein
MTDRQNIAADLDRRADALFTAVDKMDTLALRQACYVAGTALRTAAAQTRDGIEFHDNAPLVVELVGPRLVFSC